MEIQKEVVNFIKSKEIMDLIEKNDWEQVEAHALNYLGLYALISNFWQVIIESGIDLFNIYHRIPECCFYDRDDLKSFDIPNGVTSIGDNAFRDCDYIKSITLPSTVESIGDYAFHDCRELTSFTILNDDDIRIGYKAFGTYSSLAPGKLYYNGNRLIDFNATEQSNIAGTYT